MLDKEGPGATEHCFQGWRVFDAQILQPATQIRLQAPIGAKSRVGLFFKPAVCPRPFELRFMVPSIPAFSRFAAAFEITGIILFTASPIATTLGSDLIGSCTAPPPVGALRLGAAAFVLTAVF
jgi:hypothetical protein